MTNKALVGWVSTYRIYLCKCTVPYYVTIMIESINQHHIIVIRHPDCYRTDHICTRPAPLVVEIVSCRKYSHVNLPNNNPSFSSIVVPAYLTTRPHHTVTVTFSGKVSLAAAYQVSIQESRERYKILSDFN